MSFRPDIRLDDSPMEAVSCNACGVEVLARKSSWDQTSIQWSEDALNQCLEWRARATEDGAQSEIFMGCVSLREAIREAAVKGTLHVVSDEPLKTNEAGDLPSHVH